MSLVFGAVADDGIVLCADGRALFDASIPPQDNFKKIYPVGNVYVGFAGQNLYPDEVPRFLMMCQLVIKQANPFSVERFSEHMIELARMYFANAPVGFKVGFLVAGYDRDVHNKPTLPWIYRFASEQQYKLQPPYGDFRYNYLVDEVPRLQSFPTARDTNSVKLYIEQVVKDNQSASVGGDIRTVIMKGDDVQETIQTTN